MELSYAVFSIGAMAGGVTAVTLTKYLLTRRAEEARWLSTIISIISISASLLCLITLPLDVHIVSSAVDDSGQTIVPRDAVQSRQDQVRTIYYVLYSVQFLCTFVLIPFTYFYQEESDEDYGLGQKFWAALKYTLASLLCLALLAIIGLILRPGLTDPERKGTERWLQDLFDVDHAGQAAVTFILAFVTSAGIYPWLLYTAYGLWGFPIFLIQGPKSREEVVGIISSAIVSIEDRSRILRAQYAATGRSMSSRDRRSFEDLEERRRLLEDQQAEVQRGGRTLEKLAKALQPLRILMGGLAVVAVLLYVSAAVIVSIDKIMHSVCGLSCGYLLNTPVLFNPLDKALLFLAPYFPLDYLAACFVLVVVALATIYGISRIGIRLLWFRLYRVRPRKSSPSALLLVCALLSLLIFTLNFQFVYVAPQYATFGQQSFRDTQGQLMPCSLSVAANATATVTTVPVLLHSAQPLPPLNKLPSTGSPESILSPLEGLVPGTKDGRWWTETLGHVAQNGVRATAGANGVTSSSCIMSQVSRMANRESVGVPLYSGLQLLASLVFVLVWAVTGAITIGRSASGPSVDLDEQDDDW